MHSTDYKKHIYVKVQIRTQTQKKHIVKTEDKKYAVHRLQKHTYSTVQIKNHAQKNKQYILKNKQNRAKTNRENRYKQTRT